MKTILLDTNAYIFFTKGDKRVVKSVEKSDAVYLSVVTIGELYSGYFRGSKFKFNYGTLQEFLGNVLVKVKDVNLETSRIYGQICSDLLKAGKPIPTNDIWIAAHAIETDSMLITYDSHFLKIPNLRMWKELK